MNRWRDDTTTEAAAVALVVTVVAAVALLASWLCGCATQPDMPHAVGEVPAVKEAASFAASHVLRAQEVLLVETTPAAKLATSHLRIAAASLPAPTLAHRERAARYALPQEPVELTAAAGLLNDARESLSDHVAAAERRARAQAFAEAEAAKVAAVLLWCSVGLGAMATASAVAFVWLRLRSLIWSAAVLGACAVGLLLFARLVAHAWLVHVLLASFAVALACGGVVVWRAWLAPSPRKPDQVVTG